MTRSSCEHFGVQRCAAISALVGFTGVCALNGVWLKECPGHLSIRCTMRMGPADKDVGRQQHLCGWPGDWCQMFPNGTNARKLVTLPMPRHELAVTHRWKSTFASGRTLPVCVWSCARECARAGGMAGAGMKQFSKCQHERRRGRVAALSNANPNGRHDIRPPGIEPGTI